MTEVVKLGYEEQYKKEYNVRAALEEAGRCMLCEDAPCSRECPAETDPGKFIRSIRFKNFKGAAETIRKNNILGATCAMVCPYDKLCESACSRTGIDKPIQIGDLQKFAIGYEKLYDMKILEPCKASRKEKIVCIGSGPASIACAAKMALEGYNVTILEEKSIPGGMLSHGITPSRLPQEVVNQDIKCLTDLGVEIVFNRHVEPKEINELSKKFDAVVIGIGLSKTKIPEIKGSNLKGVKGALEFLEDARINRGKIKLGNNVVVIGLGDVSLDCATTARQLTDGKVTIVYRRSIEEAPAGIIELKYAQDMGIPIITEFAPEEILGKDGKVEALKCKSRDGYSEMKIKADEIIFAIGQTCEKGFRETKFRENVFIAGDFKNGGATVVQAVKEGKEAANEIIEYFDVSKKEGR